jgi:hypothetical protein
LVSFNPLQGSASFQTGTGLLCCPHPSNLQHYVFRRSSMRPFDDWVITHADELDQSSCLAEEVLPALAGAGLPRVGVPVADGGSGGDARDAVEAIAGVAERSLTAAFVLWGHRSFIEFLLQSPNLSLRERLLPRLLDGSIAGATGLSNAMKFLAGIEELQITATAGDSEWRLNGRLAWASNLRKKEFTVAVAITRTDGAPPAIVAVCSGTPNVQRSNDLKLLGLRSSNTAAIRLEDAIARPADIIAEHAQHWIPPVRPAFLSMQCGLSIGLARASLSQAIAATGILGKDLAGQIKAVREDLERNVTLLLQGLHDGDYKKEVRPLFRLRLRLAQLVQQALMLELQSSGGRAYLLGEDQGFARRWREAAFIPIITPSVTQLQSMLGLPDERAFSR